MTFQGNKLQEKVPMDTDTSVGLYVNAPLA